MLPLVVGDGTSPLQTPAHQLLPTYLEPIPSRLPAEDMEYLTKKGSFEIPNPKFRDALLRSYTEFIHPYYPMLDINEFLLNILTPGSRDCKVSLLVFQAVMFAGSAHVDIKPLRTMGFLTRKAARRALYQRTKVCLGFEYANMLMLSPGRLSTILNTSKIAYT